MKAGGRLLEEESAKIELEGGWSKFPVEAASFSKLGIENAAWCLKVIYEDPNDPFLGAVRLLVNLDHPAGYSVIHPGSSTNAPIFLSTLKADIYRQLFQQLATDERLNEQHEYEAESVGSVSAGIAEERLKSDLKTILCLAKSDPESLDRLIQDRTEYLNIRHEL